MTTFDDAPFVPDDPRFARRQALTDIMLDYLKGASPWLRFLGILGFIGAGFTAIMGLFVMVFPTTIGMFLGALDSYNYPFDVFGGAWFLMGFFYIIAGALQFFPALFTFRFGLWIRRHSDTGESAHLETALKNNKHLWKFQGIVAIVSLALVPVFIVGVIIFTLVAVQGLF